MRRPAILTWPVLGLVLTACAAHTSLAPVGSGRLVPNAGLGGPIVGAFGAYVPIPYMTAGADYGLGRRANLNGSVHLLPLAYQVMGLDAGLTWFPRAGSQSGPQIGIQPRIMMFGSVKSGVSSRLRIYPMISVSSSWQRERRSLYVGADLAGPLPQQDFDAEGASFIFSPFVGRRWNVGRGLFLLTELKWHGANVETDQLAVRYVRVLGHGALTPLFALQRSF
ncbi:MAG: hypothetical protein HY700_09395 [Gemmatimonadetes bacterium]|nr:hypothetical protein [Gemmatimonadota bacterium]